MTNYNAPYLMNNIFKLDNVVLTENHEFKGKMFNNRNYQHLF